MSPEILQARQRIEAKIQDLTPPEHEHSAQVEQAAQWLAEQPEAPPHVVRLLSEKFGIMPSQAAKACTLANTFRTNGKAFG